MTGVKGSPTIWTDNPAGSDLPVLLSQDGTLIAITSSPQYSTTNIYKNGILVTAVPGLPVGWIDNNRLLVNEYTTYFHSLAAIYSDSIIYDALGNKIATPALPELHRFQTVNADSVYSPDSNQIFSLTTGAPTWTGSQPSTRVGAVSSGYVTYVSGTRVVVESY